MQLNTNVVRTETDYGAVLLDTARGEYWELNPTGAAVLRVLLDGGGEAEAAQALVREHDVDRETAAQDASTLVHELRAARILR